MNSWKESEWDCDLKTQQTRWERDGSVSVAQITSISQRKVRFAPLMRTHEIPWFIGSDRFETQTVDPAIDQVRQPRTRIFNRLSTGRTGR